MFVYNIHTCDAFLIFRELPDWSHKTGWTASSEFGTYRLCEQRRFRRACASAQSRQNLRCSLIQAVSQEEPSDRKPDPWPLWMPGHVQLKFVMTECSKTQIRLTGLRLKCTRFSIKFEASLVYMKIFHIYFIHFFFINLSWNEMKMVPAIKTTISHECQRISLHMLAVSLK